MLKKIKKKASSFEEKEKYVSSVINAFEKDVLYQFTMIKARAHLLRCDLYLTKNSSTSNPLPKSSSFVENDEDSFSTAIKFVDDDIQKAIQILVTKLKDIPDQQVTELLARSYRLQADSCLLKDDYNNNNNSNIFAAIVALQEASKIHPPFRSKIQQEIKKLQNRL